MRAHVLLEYEMRLCLFLRSRWLPAVGLEIHAQITAKTKIFSCGEAIHSRDSQPNTSVALFDIALPGSMPVLNKRCVRAGVSTALALNATVNRCSYFDRKHYFYPDLPAGYQITQHRMPLANGGHLDVPLEGGRGESGCASVLRVQLKQIHLEQDSGKMSYGRVREGGKGWKETLVDFNRAGIGLMEIITLPDMTCGSEAVAFVRELRLLLRAIGSCDGNFEDGSLRVDANVSVRPKGEEELGVRTEVKNVSGLRFLAKAVDYELARHVEVLEGGGKITEETRSFDERRGITIPTRGKSLREDYRFMAEHDLPPLVLYGNDSTPPDRDEGINVDELSHQLPILPSQLRKQLAQRYGLTVDQCQVLMGEDGAVEYFEQVMSQSGASSHLVYSWITTELFGLLSRKRHSLKEGAVTPQQLASLLKLLQSGEVAGSSAKQILGRMADGDKRNAVEIMEGLGLQKIGAEEELEEICEEVLQRNTEEVTLYQSGRTKLLGYFIGEVMKRTGRRGDPSVIRNILVNLLLRNKQEKQ